MGNEIKATVRPTPIQRNAFDVAVELTNLYFEKFTVEGKEDIENTFIRFYAIAETLDRTHVTGLGGLLPEELRAALHSS